MTAAANNKRRPSRAEVGVAGELIGLRLVCDGDAEALQELVSNDNVYRYLPTYLFERQYAIPHEAIRHLYEGQYTHKGRQVVLIALTGRSMVTRRWKDCENHVAGRIAILRD